jgi:uncharacterized alkaline shock family protein YloU
MAEEPQQPEAGMPSQPVTISDSVVAKVAHNACREIAGVHGLGGAASRAFSSLRGESRTQGISVDIHEGGVDIDITMVASYGHNIADVAEKCRQAVRTQVEGTTGLKVREVNVVVADIHFPSEDEVEEG